MPIFVDSPGPSSALPGSGGLGHQPEQGPDGSEYFSILGPSINLVRSVRNILEAQRIYASFPQGRGRDQAAALGVILRELETAVHLSGQSTAQYAEERARSLLEKRIVRPATPHANHLKDAIFAREIVVTGQPGSWGAVGIGDIGALNRFPYWRAQEFGSTHLVGHELRGYFIGVGGERHRPGETPFRSDPTFAPIGGPKMIVENPIQGKGFLTKATLDSLAFRFRIWRNVEKAAVAQTRQVRVATAGDLAGTRFSATVGGFSRLARYRP